MVEVNIQLPDNLYWDALRVAAERQIELGDLVRGGLESVLGVARVPSEQGMPPQPVSLGMVGPIEVDEWRLLGNEPDYLPRHLRRMDA